MARTRYRKDDEQSAKCAALCNRIAQAKARGQDYECVGALEISLRINGTELAWRGISRLVDAPIYRRNSSLRMSNWAYEQYLALKEECATLGLNFKEQVLKRRPYDPAKKEADLAAYARRRKEDTEDDESD